MSPNLNARGLGLGETPLRRWGGYRGSVIVSVGHRQRRRNAKLSIAVHRLVLHRSAPPTGVAKRRDRQRTCAGRALNCGIVEATTGKTRGHQVPKRPNTPYKTKHYKGWDGLGPQIEFGWAQQDVTKPQLPWVEVRRDALRRWGGHRHREHARCQARGSKRFLCVERVVPSAAFHEVLHTGCIPAAQA